jgi:predicted GNAT family acetyltransferase
MAKMTYTVAGTRVIIDHTDMDERLRGTGAGKSLVHAAVEWARAENARLLPLCPFARSVFDKTPEYADVLAK